MTDRDPLLEGLTGSPLGGSETGHRLNEVECKIPTLEKEGLLLGNDRDDDRIRLIRYIVDHPEGAPISQIWRDVFGRSGPVDPGDADYQFTRRFYTGNDQYFDTTDQNGMTVVEFRLCLLDLIREGISQKKGSTDDRGYCRNSLARTSSLTDDHKETLADSLQQYVHRIDDYRMLFRVHDLRSGDSDLMHKPYLTRFNSAGRIKQQWARYNCALEHARDNCGNAVLATLTTDPKKFPHLLESWEDINENFNRLMSWMDYEPKTKPSSRPGYRPPYIKILEATEDGKPHLHILFFDVPTRPDGRPKLIDKQELSDRWDDLGQGQIVDLQGLDYRDDLDDAYSVEEGFISLNESARIDRGDPLVAPDGGSSNGVGGGQTAGQYLGKYLSAMFGGVMELASGGDFEVTGYDDKAATWKLALYWATNRRMWSLSEDIEENIDLDDEGDLRDLPVRIEYIGTYPYWDLPASVTLESRQFSEFTLTVWGDEPDPDSNESIDTPPPASA